MTQQPLDDLLDAARSARDRAYAPYSKFQVGAALRSRDGRTFSGFNIENVSYGLCNCAERTAFHHALASGCEPLEFTHLAVIGDTREPITPCGACRQVIVELGGPGLIVVLANLAGDVSRTTAADLLPGSFRMD